MRPGPMRSVPSLSGTRPGVSAALRAPAVAMGATFLAFGAAVREAGLGLPWALGKLGGYDLTYGSLAGVVVLLTFFYLIGLGVVFGAHLNAALAEPPEAALNGAPVEGAVAAPA